ncbi:HRDC-domain-containing protein [Daldinia eschscholtzii]|nr:HRDC-domain-containing protein [Daldinia eschscholtzii]
MLAYHTTQLSRLVRKSNLTFLWLPTNNLFTSSYLGYKVDRGDDTTKPSPHQLTEKNCRMPSSMLEDSTGPQMWHKLFGQLVSHRKKHAEEQDVPLYMIATNNVLEQLAKIRPTNKNQLLKVKGIGKRKVEAYGDEWLKIISEDIAKHPKSFVELNSLSEPEIANGPHHQRDNFQKQQESDAFKQLYRRLALHRSTQAILEDRPPFIVASNSLLENLARKRPSNQHELLNIHGVGIVKAAEYGSDWLRIIAEFEAEYKSEPAHTLIPDAPVASYTTENTREPEAGDQLSKQRQIKTVGRSKEILLTQPFPSSRLSFGVGETRPNAVEASTEKDGSENYDNSSTEETFEALVPHQLPRQLKRKRDDDSQLTYDTNPSLTHDPDSTSAPTAQPTDKEVIESEPLSREQKLLRKKLDAYVKSVVWAMDPKPNHPIVSEDTLRCLVTTLPQTLDELRQIPDIEGFLKACEMAKKDLWRTFSTWIQAPGLIQRT